MKKLLSIIIPVYNAESTISRTLRSLRNIKEENRGYVEVLVIDDGSTDSSMNIINIEKGLLSPLKFICMSQANQGTSVARNLGLKNASGEWIAFLDADDELFFDPVDYIRQNQHNSALGFCVRIYKNNKYIRELKPVKITPENHLDVFTRENACTVSGIVIRKDRIRAYFVPDILYLEDWQFWLDNPGVFENMRIFRKVTASIIYVHRSNKSSEYRLNGIYREKIADEFRKKMNTNLSRKQINNLIIQAAIGRILQGKKLSLESYLVFPCSAVLFIKFLIYLILKGHFVKIGLYGNR